MCERVDGLTGLAYVVATHREGPHEAIHRGRGPTQVTLLPECLEVLAAADGRLGARMSGARLEGMVVRRKPLPKRSPRPLAQSLAAACDHQDHRGESPGMPALPIHSLREALGRSAQSKAGDRRRTASVASVLSDLEGLLQCTDWSQPSASPWILSLPPTRQPHQR